MVTRFADVSHHQAQVNLTTYRSGGHDRIVLKATEGTGFVDPAFITRWKQAGELGLARVAYHFARAKFSGMDEFDHFWTVVQTAGGLTRRDRACLDVEDTDTPHRAAANVQEFGRRAQARGVSQGLVYTGNWYANPNGITADLLPPGWRQLWLSNYDSSVSDTNVAVPRGWSRDQLKARQYTASANVPGVSGPCDYSRVLQDWLIGGQPEPRPTQEVRNMVLIGAQTGVVLIVGDQRYSLNTAIVADLRRQGVPYVEMKDKSIPGLYELGTSILEGTPPQ